MKRSVTSTLAVIGGGALGFAARQLWSKRKSSAGDTAMRRLSSYFVIPVWIGAGFADYLWHRRTNIETTSGLSEGLMHTVMMAEAAPPVLAGVFLEINAGVLAWMIALTAAHELTVLWDLTYTAPRRTIPAGEQVTHTFLEAPPMVVTAAAIVTHWGQFLALMGRGNERARFEIRLQRPRIGLSTVLLIFAGMGLFGALPHIDELRRCIQAKKEGLAGRDTPACLPEVFSN
jgi:hypothetical protein